MRHFCIKFINGCSANSAMKGMVRILLFVLIFMSAVFDVSAQKNVGFVEPFDFQLLLSGNFGELRSNHFHAGVDFKTQGVVGKPIRSVSDGYICRVRVQSGGYGRALYVMHDNGYMTVYGHLHAFPDGVAKRVRDCQYMNETFEVDLDLSPSDFPVRKGEILAWAGNSGYSFGPHLHFEVRDSTGNELYDPMTFYKSNLRDTVAPRASAFSVYPLRGEGVVDGKGESKVCKVVNGVVADSLEAWGMIGFGVKAQDYMNDTHNKYGVYSIRLVVDGVERFSSKLANFSFDENRIINAWVDYERYMNTGEWYQKMYIPGVNPLRALQVDSLNGVICIDEERPYCIECHLSDYHDNTTIYKFIVNGRKMPQPEAKPYTHVLYRGVENNVEFLGMKLYVPKGELFEDAFLNIRMNGDKAFSECYDIGGMAYPLWHGGELSLRVNDSLAVHSSKLYMKRVTKKGGYSVGGKYDCGWLTADINILGCYEIAVDTVPPRVLPVKENTWTRNGRVVFRVADGHTSIKSFKGYIDGEFVLFEYSSKNSLLTLDLKKERVARGKHKLKVVVVDACGNETVLEKDLKY